LKVVKSCVLIFLGTGLSQLQEWSLKDVKNTTISTETLEKGNMIEFSSIILVPGLSELEVMTSEKPINHYSILQVNRYSKENNHVLDFDLQDR
jgi:hypothetical protein